MWKYNMNSDVTAESRQLLYNILIILMQFYKYI